MCIATTAAYPCHQDNIALLSIGHAETPKYDSTDMRAWNKMNAVFERKAGARRQPHEI